MATLREILDNTTFLIISDPSSDLRYKRIRKLIESDLSIRGNCIKKFDATMIPENPSLGCNLSHSKAIMSYPDSGYLCVMEDDIGIFELFKTTSLDIEIPEDFLGMLDCIYLGASSWGYMENYHNKAKPNGLMFEKTNVLSDIFVRVKNMFSAHAILYLKKDYAELISNGIMNSSVPNYIEPNDVTNAKSQDSHFCVSLKTPIFYQIGEHEYCTKIILN